MLTPTVRRTWAPRGRTPVLDAWDLPHLTVKLAYPSRKHLSAKVRTFIDFIAEHFERMEYERKWTARFGY